MTGHMTVTVPSDKQVAITQWGHYSKMPEVYKHCKFDIHAGHYSRTGRQTNFLANVYSSLFPMTTLRYICVNSYKGKKTFREFKFHQYCEHGC